MAQAIITDPSGIVPGMLTRDIIRSVSTSRALSVDGSFVHVTNPATLPDLDRYWDGQIPQVETFDNGTITIAAGSVTLTSPDIWPDWAGTGTLRFIVDNTDPDFPVWAEYPVSQRIDDTTLWLFERVSQAITNFELINPVRDWRTWKAEGTRPVRVVRFSAAEMEAAQNVGLVELRAQQHDQIRQETADLFEDGHPYAGEYIRNDAIPQMIYQGITVGVEHDTRNPPYFVEDIGGWPHTVSSDNDWRQFHLSYDDQTDAIIGTGYNLVLRLDELALDDKEEAETIMAESASRTAENVQQLYQDWGGPQEVANLIAARELRENPPTR